MHRNPPNAAPSAASMYPGPSQASSLAAAGRPPASQVVGRPAPASVSRSEAGVSVDLSAASNTAANGEDAMELLQHGSSTHGSQAPKAVPQEKSREAEEWFQDSNRNASTRGNVSFVDDDPPFHLPTSELAQNKSLPVRVTDSSRIPPSFNHMESIQSSGSEEFRAVIDDLTIENKKLKKENRQLKRQHATHTHPDKLFEVRMHGLDAKEKKQLMQMLRSFNDTLGKSRGGYSGPVGKKRYKRGSNKPSSSSTLHSNSNNPVDSAYASGSTSGNASQSQAAESRTVAAPADTGRPTPRRQDQDQNVRSYLMNMSKGLLPRQPAVMTELARKKLVVRKLEQLYTGKPNTSKKNSQSDQQQQVSTEAANEQKRQTEAVGRTVPAEGSREAVIFPDADLPQQDSNNGGNSGNDSNVNTPDQRPTRPVDLDLSRAQNPAENMAYIRHLGFKASDRQRSRQRQPGGDGVWVPLNLLMNLAQLHTLNVTPESVKQALSEISDKFEISADGSKVRWNGGLEGTRMSGDSASSADSKENSPIEGAQYATIGRPNSPPRSRSSKPSPSEQTTGMVKSSGGTGSGSGVKTESNNVTASTGITSSSLRDGKRVFLGSVSREDTFSYQPIFLHGAAGSEEENEYFLDENDSLLSSGLREDTTGSGSGFRSRRAGPLPVKEEGAIIFYHRARFCTDLSGDHDIVPVNTTQFTRNPIALVGLTSNVKPDVVETRGALTADAATRRGLSVEVEDAPQVRMLDLEGAARPASREVMSDPYLLPVSGLGSHMLLDNIVLWPKYKRSIRIRSKPLVTLCRKFMRERLLGRNMVYRSCKSERLDVSLVPYECPKRDLPPSEFPSPGFFNQWSSSESADGWSDDEEEEGDSKSENLEAADEPAVPPTFGTTAFESHSGEADESEEDDGDDEPELMEDDNDDDDEIDMLAYDRAHNAEEIARREREWDEQVNDVDEGDDAGSEGKRSSAATVGDRSFLSDDDEEEEGMSPSRMPGGAVAGHKREREREELTAESSPAKRVESERTRNGRK